MIQKCNRYQRIAISLLFLGIGTLPAMTQSTRANLEKYGLYRARFLERFVELGTGHGMGLPADRYNPDPWYFANQPNTKALFWSDAPVHLGFYLAVLATEFELKRRNNYDLSDLIQELYYALNALWRLDANSGSFSYNNSNWASGGCSSPTVSHLVMNGSNYNDPTLLDGFFIRDDVPLQFHSHFDDVDTVSADMLVLVSGECRNKEMSRDNAIYLYLGLLCVQEFVDPSASYNGVPLRTFAIYEATRIFNAIKGNGDWVLRNPHNNDEPVFRGNGKGIEGIFFHNAFPFVRKTFNGGNGNFHNSKSSAWRYLWNQLQYPFILSPTGINRFMSEGMIACLGATGNSWSHCPFPSPFLQPFTCNGYGGINTTSLGMNRYASRAKEAQYLIYDLIFGANVLNPHVTPSTMRAMLNTAPCGGPYSVFPNEGIYGWCVPNRFWTQRKSKGVEGGRNENLVYGLNNSDGDEYNGLDYMLLHNLYWLRVDGQGYHDPEYHWEDVRHTRVDNAWPYFHAATAGIYNVNALNAWLGSNQNPRVIRAIHTLRANTRLRAVNPNSDTFWQNAHVTYRAGEEIDLTDGFEVDFGSSFEAYIEPMECVGGHVGGRGFDCQYLPGCGSGGFVGTCLPDGFVGFQV